MQLYSYCNPQPIFLIYYLLFRRLNDKIFDDNNDCNESDPLYKIYVKSILIIDL